MGGSVGIVELGIAIPGKLDRLADSDGPSFGMPAWPRPSASREGV
jgi:hypothetical protein